MLMRQIERVQRATAIDELVVATSIDDTDTRIVEACITSGVECFRGSENDVLDRFYQAAAKYHHHPTHVIRLTGDCPLVDPAIIDAIADFHIRGGFDYSSNIVEPTFPDGLDVEIMTFASLEKSWRESSLPSHREHVTQFILQNQDQFKIGNWQNAVDLSTLRWTVDEPEDYQLVTGIYEALYPANPHFNMQDVMTYLSNNPGLMKLNESFYRNEGLQKSLQDDLLVNKANEEG
jgi:spore coat polysaccharide biosynthesis protein SpsF